MLEMAKARLYRFWGNLTEVLRTGLPRNEVRDGSSSPFETLYTDRSGALEDFSGRDDWNQPGRKYRDSESTALEEIPTFADVGTAQGDLAVQIAPRNPHLTGIGSDLRQVGPVFQEYVNENGLADRPQFQAGDFFNQSLPKVDLILMGHILHDWGLKTKKMLIRRAYDALPTGGILAIYDSLMHDDR
jgi:hypothetical protein